MIRYFFAAFLSVAPLGAVAAPSVVDILEHHILPGFATLAARTERLQNVAANDCAAGSEALRDAYGAAFDAWIAVSHLRFGPTEVDDRAFALAFWPDSRGATPRALSGLIATKDPISNDPAAYREVSIAARGFYALEFMLYDETIGAAGDAAYRCSLIRTLSADINHSVTAIHADWRDHYANVLLSPGPDATYRSDLEVLQEMLRALSAGLQFTQDSRLGRPLGTFDRPRPARAEARRSGRSARHVTLSLMALQDLAARLAAGDTELAQTLGKQFDHVLGRLAALDDPAFKGVADPIGRLRVEVIAQAVGTIRTTVQAKLGPTLGVAAGFNALDGD